MTKVELVDKGVYWVRRNERTDGVPGELRLAQFSRMEARGTGKQYVWFSYFGTDDDDMPEDVIVVAGPLDIPPPEACTDWAAFAREQVAEAEARGWRRDANLGWVLDIPEPEKEADK